MTGGNTHHYTTTTLLVKLIDCTLKNRRLSTAPACKLGGGRRHLYMVLDNWEKGYSIYRVEGAGGQLPLRPQPRRAPPPSPRSSASRPKHHIGEWLPPFLGEPATTASSTDALVGVCHYGEGPGRLCCCGGDDLLRSSMYDLSLGLFDLFRWSPRAVSTSTI